MSVQKLKHSILQQLSDIEDDMRRWAEELGPARLATEKARLASRIARLRALWVIVAVGLFLCVSSFINGSYCVLGPLAMCLWRFVLFAARLTKLENDAAFLDGVLRSGSFASA